MKVKKYDTKALDAILEKMINTVDHSKSEIYQIGESCRQDYTTLSEELKEVKMAVLKIIEEGDRLDRMARASRKRLSEVSRRFTEFSEEEVKRVYEEANKIQMTLSMNREKEKQLRIRRDELERRLVGLAETIERADNLVSQITVVMNYLQSDLQKVSELLEDANLKHHFSIKIIEAQEEERRRLSREIHDGPAQMMANVMLRSDLIEKIFLERGADEALAEIRNVKRMVRDALYEVRHIIYDLRPMALDDLGLIPALRKYLQTTEEYFNTSRLRFVCLGEERRLPAKYEVSFFRLIQESVQNAMKHAEAKEVLVKLELLKDKATIIIQDDGKGFDKEIQKESSFGLIGMKERVDLLDGEMTIDSEIGKGTTVTIKVPLRDIH